MVKYDGVENINFSALNCFSCFAPRKEKLIVKVFHERVCNMLKIKRKKHRGEFAVRFYIGFGIGLVAVGVILLFLLVQL